VAHSGALYILERRWASNFVGSGITYHPHSSCRRAWSELMEQSWIGTYIQNSYGISKPWILTVTSCELCCFSDTSDM